MTVDPDVLEAATAQQASQIGNQLVALGMAELTGSLDLGNPRPLTDSSDEYGFVNTALAHYLDNVERVVTRMRSEPELLTALSNARTLTELGEALPDEFYVARSVLAPRSIEHPAGSPEAEYYALADELDEAIESGDTATIDTVNGKMIDLLDENDHSLVGSEFATPLSKELAFAAGITLVPGKFNLDPSLAAALRNSAVTNAAIALPWDSEGTAHPSDIAPGVSGADIKANSLRAVIVGFNESSAYLYDLAYAKEVDRLVDLQSENGQIQASNEELRAGIERDLGLARDVQRLARLGPGAADWRVRVGTDNPDRPAGYEDPYAEARAQMEALRGVKVSDTIAGIDDERTWLQVYEDAHPSGSPLTEKKIAEDGPFGTLFFENLAGKSGLYVPQALVNEVIKKFVKYFEFDPLRHLPLLELPRSTQRRPCRPPSTTSRGGSSGATSG